MAEASPLSIRLGADRRERIERYMARRGVPIRGAVLELVDMALAFTEMKKIEISETPPSRRTPPGYQPGAVTAEALRRLKETPDHD